MAITTRDFAAELQAARAAQDWAAHERIWEERRHADVDADEAMLTANDSSCVFHIDILDADIRAERDPSLPWVFETNEDQNSFATEDEACAAQRAYRQERGFDPISGCPYFTRNRGLHFYIA